MTDVLQLASELIRRNVPCALCTIIKTSGSVPRHPGAKMLVSENGSIVGGTVGGGSMESRVCDLAKQSLSSGKSTLIKYQLSDPRKGDPGVCGGEVEVFIEPLLMKPTILIIGAGHVGRALTYLARWSGFRVLLADDRPDLCTPEECPGADEYIKGALIQTLGQTKLTPQTFVALVTRGYPIDVEILPILLQSPASYIGVIGSQRRWLTTSKVLRERGLTDTDLARIHAPIGLEIAAETPEEIAISIMAEIVRVHRGQEVAARVSA